MNKKIVLLISFGLLLLLVGGWVYISNTSKDLPASEVEVPFSTSDPRDIPYTIEGESYTLIKGVAEKELVPGSASKSRVAIFGQPVLGDVDGDGDYDALVLLENERGGSGVFYYVAFAIHSDGVYTSTDTMLLGDRIAPQTLSIEGDTAVVNYADRALGEPFTTPPSMGKSLYLQVDTQTLKLRKVESTADAGALDVKTWTWIKTSYSDGAEFVPKKTGAFTLTFKNDNTFSATTDCNSMSGAYTIEEGKINFANMVSTLMFCDASEELFFSTLLRNVESFTFTANGELVLGLMSGAGFAYFR
jgi:heat shock protein HslJ